ncbi:aldehyde dehydrogenase family protein [Neobacillus mesonae]|uniref:aldehyde dehydrogenase family protein n=1 Tax=Neobacillus mesonae TaxID=1193713 RepID=UPI00203B89D6|nr:aldehyde dehydrogenase family protein [Neobacillus mesonae]MCM3567062.1 aldehyde dehydrogenase family protein [Neobacillus mesonae]
MTQYFSLTKSYMNGEWVEGETGRTYNDLNPFDDSVAAKISIASKAQLESAFEAANKAQKEWAKDPGLRKSVIEKVIAYFKEHQQEIVEVLVTESGSSVLKSNVEVSFSIADLEESLKMIDQVGKSATVDSVIPGKVNKVYRLPLGVISSISPFNFPLYLSMRTIAPALALGNAVVHKADIQTGISGGSIIAKAFEEAGVPAGVFNSILTDISEIGDTMITNPYSKLISFTGSTGVGKHIGEAAGGLLKRTALELGGNNPFVVLKDADVDQAVKAAIMGKYLHQGQICMSINRIIVHEDLYDEFARKFVEQAKQIPYGNPKDPSTVIGPLINHVQMDKALSYIGKAKEAGNELLLEGKREGNVLTPYIFGNVKNNSSLAQTELFSPVVSLIKAPSDQEAIEMANDTSYGLSSAVFTSDLARGEEAAVQIEAGMTHVNDQTVNCLSNTPFGGMKGSGIGRFGNPWIVDEFTQAKWVSVQEKPMDYPF